MDKNCRQKVINVSAVAVIVILHKAMDLLNLVLYWRSLALLCMAIRSRTIQFIQVRLWINWHFTCMFLDVT